jgi:hypothetical protein
VQESLVPNGMGCKASLIKVGSAIQLTLWAEGLVSLKTLKTVATAIVLVSPSNSIAYTKMLGFWTNSLDGTNTFMAEDHIFGFLKISSADFQRMLL